jgi:hypothetical protein
MLEEAAEDARVDRGDAEGGVQMDGGRVRHSFILLAPMPVT